MTRLLFAASLMLAGVVAYGADEPTPRQKYHDPRAAFAESDTNHDGAVDHEEFHARIVEVFYSADRNKDGSLDEVELEALVFPDDFGADDKDGNGRVSMREFLRVRFRDFRSADKNDDEVLTVEEVVGAYEGRRK
jgi:Ca2+-binding EF-hand superfamily protein